MTSPLEFLCKPGFKGAFFIGNAVYGKNEAKKIHLNPRSFLTLFIAPISLLTLLVREQGHAVYGLFHAAISSIRPTSLLRQ
jgi:hypothetical protein